MRRREFTGGMPEPIITPQRFAHVRLTVTVIGCSKAFFEQVFGMPRGRDFSDQILAASPSRRVDAGTRRTVDIDHDRRSFS
jgi:hypothetical protein